MQNSTSQIDQYKIGALAQTAGVKVETLRYYESEGLLNPKKRTAAGYRLYSVQDLHSLFFILQAKKVGFSLKEIKFLLDFQSNKDEHTCQEVKQYTGNKISELESKIHDLQEMKQKLTELHQACCGGVESAKHCSILQAFEGPTDNSSSTCNDRLV